MNRRTLQEIVKGEYGRKIAYTDVEEITPENVLSVVNAAMGVFSWNKRIADYLWKYKNGDQPILYRHKKVRSDIIDNIVENHAYEIVQFKTAQSYGEPIQYVSRRKDDKINELVEVFNDYMYDANKQTRDIAQGEWQSAVGTSYKALQPTGNEEQPFRIVVPTPLNTGIIYNRATNEPMLSVQDLVDEEGKSYLHCFSNNKEFRIQDDRLLAMGVAADGNPVFYKLHAYGDVPIVEYPNNQDRLSDIELVITMLDSINVLQSNRVEGIEQFVQSFMKFINVEIDKEIFEEMRQMGAFMIKSTNTEGKSDVDIISQELNQTEGQVVKNDILDNILSIEGIPNKEGNTGGDTAGAVELRNGWDFSKQRAKLKDPYIVESERRFAKIALNIIRINGKNDCPLSSKEFDVQISHSPLDNISVKVNALSLLLKCGIHPLIAIKTCGLWGDAEKTFLMSKSFLENLYKTIDSDTVKVEEQEKKANVLLKLLSAGVSPEEACKKVGIEYSESMNDIWGNKEDE